MNELKELAKDTEAIYHINPSKIKVREGFNPRYEMGDLKELEKSIEENGVREPLSVTVENGEVMLGANGHRRLQAVFNLTERGVKIPTVPVRAEENGTSESARALDTIILNTSKTLELLEQAVIFGRLVEGKEDDAKREEIRLIAEAIGKTVKYVQNGLLLLTATPHTLKLIRMGKVAATWVIELLKEEKGNAEQVEAIVTEALEKAEEKGKGKATKKDSKKKKSKESGEGDEDEDSSYVEIEERLTKLEKVIEKLNPETCNGTVLEAASKIVAFLRNGRVQIDTIKSLIKD